MRQFLLVNQSMGKLCKRNQQVTERQLLYCYVFFHIVLLFPLYSRQPLWCRLDTNTKHTLKAGLKSPVLGGVVAGFEDVRL